MANIDDVAKKAGVSKSTVSRVLLGGNKVKPSTKERVLKVIEEMNYSPNTAARTLAAGKSHNIGVISSYTLNDPFYSAAGEEIYHVCGEMGYSTLFVINRTDKNEHKDPIALLHGKVDGFLFMGDNSVTKEQLEKLTKMELPTAVFKTGEWIPGIIQADTDNIDGACRGTEYLIRLGHRRIAILTGKENYYESIDRMKGYQKALEENHIRFESELVFPGQFSYDKARNLAKEIIASRATAVFCFNDVMAHGFIQGAGECGYRVPEDISVLGYDNIMFSNYDSYVHLSTVKQPIKEMSAYLVRALIAQIEDGQPPVQKIFPTKISEKETTR
ncbi:transcriptional regulator, LacI family [Marvinbryantia formatexigens DSM 14469]|uniref:Transcriptional regulator, LacI family n=1 Tax=Marvinbryantia formatexigens DSM 14469 TaxID=478749 RepID=C6LDZ5_9FIRM|nr:LacI family DNA-binding transcriptional regulator [Marvinbryantia formatexigens]EET61199.1 transcriptional regulator, LacI family [Marvinbryantia formatexigens DSM 14469]UWO23760.1 LacI family transcriptional regulator [Marvinbryantia formatexigens DSM 14469]SDF69727.1 transcriptional regulator, LacI family [Marvinbryantia formatexigens]